MKDKFIVKIPLDQENESAGYKEVRFKTRHEITELLQITTNTLNTMLNYDFKCHLNKHKHLKGIKIERIMEEEPEIPIDAVEYHRKLLEKI